MDSVYAARKKMQADYEGPRIMSTMMVGQEAPETAAVAALGSSHLSLINNLSLRQVIRICAKVVIVAVSFNAISAASDVDQEIQVSADSITPINVRVKRFLITNKAVNDGEERVPVGKGIINFTKTTSLETLEDVVAGLGAVRGSSKYATPLRAENDWAMIKVGARRRMPDRLDEVLGTAAKRATVTDDQLMNDPGYLFATHFREFWDACKAKPIVRSPE
ncbi:hypothetical protein PHMEG_00033953 [Phytophthora megakarya]|uniref:RxLR effector protein n=1 Tax=Phytophthora megakarya TaxID=4795 RepID=A0A225US46_9STRA|nr:hypothetical protein PHMEG_00033953 [Phytophthora megakarya]